MLIWVPGSGSKGLQELLPGGGDSFDMMSI